MRSSPIKGYILTFILLLVTACGEKVQDVSRKSEARETDYRSDENSYEYQGDISVSQWHALNLSIEEQLPANQRDKVWVPKGDLPEGLSWNNETQRLTGGAYEAGVHTLSFERDDGPATTSFTLAVQGDPFANEAWHLDNRRQKAWAISRGKADYDIRLFNALSTWDLTNGPVPTGMGIRVAISDSGVETTHPDLVDRELAGLHRDYSKEEWPNKPIPFDGHGTAVAGLLGASGTNNIGVRGVAPGVKMAFFQFLDSDQDTEILIDQASGDFDIFNYSYGDSSFRDQTSNAQYLDYIRFQYINGRQGLGVLYFKSVGNEFIETDDIVAPSICASHNANAPLENEAPWFVMIGAINARGKKASYSSAGSNLWVVGPGGEYGDSAPALISTDLTTCFKGFGHVSFGANDFDMGLINSNDECNYTASMNGTSGATPIIGGVAALLMEANDELTTRDIKHILAMTARNDLDEDNTTYPHPSNEYSQCPNLDLVESDDSLYTYEQGWVENSAGVKFHNHFGFGLVQADRALAMANDFSSDPMGWLPLPFLVELNNGFILDNMKDVVDEPIPDNDSTGVSSSINITADINVETVQVKVKATHSLSGQLGVELTSPAGTKSILLNYNNSFLISEDQNLNIVLTSNAFYGENSVGDWTIKVFDAQASQTGTFDSWEINLLGHNP